MVKSDKVRLAQWVFACGVAVMVWDLLRRLVGGGGASNIGTGKQSTASDGGTAVTAGDNSNVTVIGEQHNHPSSLPPAIDWWLMDGAPDVWLNVIHPRDSLIVGGDIRFTVDVREVELRVRGMDAPGEWFTPSRENLRNGGRVDQQAETAPAPAMVGATLEA